MSAMSILPSVSQKSVLDIPPAPWVVHDRVNQFIIENGHLMWRPFEEGDWTEASLPGDLRASQVKADWDNLMVLDVDGDVHYAKSVQGTDSQMNHLHWHKGIWDLPVISEI